MSVAAVAFASSMDPIASVLEASAADTSYTPPQIIAALRIAGMTGEHDRVRACGNVWREIESIDTATGELQLTYSPLRCRSRYCQPCAEIFTRRTLDHLATIDRKRPSSFTTLLTLT